MSDYLTNLAAKTLAPEPAIQPRLTSRYEPLRVFEAMISVSRPRWDPLNVTDEPDETAFDEDPRITHSIRRPTRRSTKTVMPAQLAAEATHEPVDASPQISELLHDQSAVTPPTRRPPRRSTKTVMPAQPAAEDTHEPVDDSLQISATRHDQPIVSPPTRRGPMRPVVETRVAPENPVAEITTESEQHKSVRVLSVQGQTTGQFIPTLKEHSVTQARQRQTDSKVPSLIDGTAGDSAEKPAAETGARRDTRIDFLVRQSVREGTPPLETDRPFALDEPKADQVSGRVKIEKPNPLGQSQLPVIPSPPETTRPGRVNSALTPVVIVQPHSVTRARPLREVAAAPQESPTTEPTVQVTIGRIEIRASTNAESRRDVQQLAPSKLMSLDDYLRQRAQGVGR